MKSKALALLLTIGLMLPGVRTAAQPAPGGRPMGGVAVDTWEVNIKPMDSKTSDEITETMSLLNGDNNDRGIIAQIGKAVGFGLISGLVDVVVSETFNLIQYRKKQKREWMQMIQNENNYTDSITSIKGLKDFYKEPSTRGALDPSDINFDGIEIRGMRNGQEAIYMSCSIDRDKLDHMFRHSKFNLVIDTLAFYPYQCHLPNVTANGIRTMNELKKGKAQVKGDTIIRPGTGGNGFSFDERNNLRVAIDFSLSSSWINQAVQVHQNVQLGDFRFLINIPDNVLVYTYSRKNVLAKAQGMSGRERDEYLNRELLKVDGDCFVVPRSYMPLGDGTPRWGTGEYNIKVKVRESCQFADDSEKARHWHEDYKRLRQMQHRSSEVKEYFQTLWNQNGMKLLKTSYSTALGIAVKSIPGNPAAASMMPGGAAAASAAARAGGGGQQGGGQPGAGQQPGQQPGAPR